MAIQWQRKDSNLGSLARATVLKHFSCGILYKPAHDNGHIWGCGYRMVFNAVREYDQESRLTALGHTGG